MIADLERFIREEMPFWRELEKLLDRMEGDIACRMDIDGVTRFHYLYQRTSSDLARMGGFAADPELRTYLESLVSRGFSEIHEGRRNPRVSALPGWLLRAFPAAFRRRISAFWLAVAITFLGVALGSVVVHLDRTDKVILLPFEHLQGSPAERVAREEQKVNRNIGSSGLTFSSQLMTNNIRVAISCMALGFTFGIGTLVILFYNGIMLGAVAMDYVSAGKTVFLCGWLLPHGVVEIPAILIAGQAGFVLAGALIGRSTGLTLAQRLRLIWSDLVALVGGVAIMLVWAGLVEALFSQYHEPVLPYSLKIAFGVVELAALSLFLARTGSQATQKPPVALHV